MRKREIRSEVIHCVVCTCPVPPERLKHRAVTCKKECADDYAILKRKKQDAKECRFCRKPSTPKQRAAFLRFRLLESKRPDLLYPEEFLKWQQAKVEGTPARTPEDFRKYWTKLHREEECR